MRVSAHNSIRREVIELLDAFPKQLDVSKKEEEMRQTVEITEDVLQRWYNLLGTKNVPITLTNANFTAFMEDQEGVHSVCSRFK